MNLDSIKNKVSKLPNSTTRPMFGYECFSVNGKFFVGFNRKNTQQIIVRLSKEEQQKAIRNKAIRPFSHGAKSGWIEIDFKLISMPSAFSWIKKGYESALALSKK
jgi:predicted DNA-binding protein (MmcQ/YjbR family)